MNQRLNQVHIVNENGPKYGKNKKDNENQNQSKEWR
jgi:hypothetical protein